MTTVRVMAGRPCNVTLHCTACQATLTLFGPWDGPAIAAWSDAHHNPVLSGWGVADGTGYLSHVEAGHLPPPVLVIQRQ